MSTTTHTRPALISDAQRAVLAAAAQRPDSAVIMPARLRGKAAARLVEALLGTALVREVRAKGELPVWRTDQAHKRYGLVLTKAGRALVTEQAGAAPEPATAVSASVMPTPVMPAPAPAAGEEPAGPRGSSKLAEVIALLRREAGSSVAELMAVTGWQPHTTRAALTGLRKRGYAVTRQAAASGSGSVYRIASAPAAAAA